MVRNWLLRLIPGFSSKDPLISKVSRSPYWYFTARQFSTPSLRYISIPGVSGVVGADRLFEAMGLDLVALSQIFVPGNAAAYYALEPSNRPVQPVASSYSDLGGLPAWASDGWLALAKLVGKTIHCVYVDQYHDVYREIVFREDGTYEILPEAKHHFRSH